MVGGCLGVCPRSARAGADARGARQRPGGRPPWQCVHPVPSWGILVVTWAWRRPWGRSRSRWPWRWSTWRPQQEEAQIDLPLLLFLPLLLLLLLLLPFPCLLPCRRTKERATPCSAQCACVRPQHMHHPLFIRHVPLQTTHTTPPRHTHTHTHTQRERESQSHAPPCFQPRHTPTTAIAAPVPCPLCGWWMCQQQPRPHCPGAAIAAPAARGPLAPTDGGQSPHSQ